MMSTISLGNLKVSPGQKKWGSLLIQEGGKSLKIPLVIIYGRKPGKRLVLLGGQHADELDGMEAVRRFCTEVDPRKMSGCIMAIPSANPMASMLGDCCWAEDAKAMKSEAYNSRYNMYYLWPGRTGGTLVERVVYEIWNQVIHYRGEKPDLLVDVHRGPYPQSTLLIEEERELEFAAASGFRRIGNCRREEAFKQGRASAGRHNRISILNGLFYVAPRAGILHLLVELGGKDGRFQEVSKESRRMLWNLTAKLGMVRKRLELADEIVISDPWRSAHHPNSKSQPSHVPCLSEHAGIVVRLVEAMQYVTKGQVIVEILNPFTAQIVEVKRSPMTGMVMNVTDKKSCQKGDWVFTICEAWRIQPQEVLNAKSRILKRVTDSLFQK